MAPDLAQMGSIPPEKALDYDVIIIGAGVTGLTTALDLAQAGYKVKIIDKNEHVLDYSKAILINSKSMILLSSLGVDALIMKKAIAVKTMSVYGKDQKTITGQIQYGTMPYCYSLPQQTTEDCLIESLKSFHVLVDRPQVFDHFTQQDQYVTAFIKENDQLKTFTCCYLIGADGFNSDVRAQLNINYPVKSVPNEYVGVDVTLNLSNPSDVGLFLEEDGIVLSFKLGEQTYRLAATSTTALESFYKRHEPEHESWRAHFMSYFAVAKRYGDNRVWLAGDAAHSHSPIASRGMNMGIEDAVALSKAIQAGSFDSYERMRRPATEQWVKLNYKLTLAAVMSGKSGKRLRKAIQFFVNTAGKINPEKTVNVLFYQIAGLSGGFFQR